MISVIAWVPKGAPKSVPSVAELPTKEEIEEMINTGILDGGGDSDADMDDRRDGENKNRIDDDDEDDSHDDIDNDDDGDDDDIQKPSNDDKLDDIADGLKELDMDNYDEEDDNAVDMFKGPGDLYYPSNALDPYLKNKDEDEDSEDIEDLTINPTDSVIVCSRNNDDGHQIEVWVCEDTVEDGINTYVHHEIMAYDFILCMAWLDCPLNGGDKGNFMAVGSMGPAIEIWDLDVIDAVQPCKVLGGIEMEKRKKGKKKVIYKEGSHTDSVLGLAWNKQYRNVLASASADNQVKIWDVAAEKCDITMQHHTDKVQAVAWNPHVPRVLLSGSFDQTVVMRDGRDPTHPGYKWAVESDVESLAWDPHNEHLFVVSLSDGTVKGFDIRTATSDLTIKSKPSFTLHAHDKAVCSVSYNPAAPNFLATGSEDKSVKLWDLSNNQPSCIASKNPKAGAVFSLAFSEDNPFLLALGGSKGRLEMWDTLSDAAISKRFGNYNKRKC